MLEQTQQRATNTTRRKHKHYRVVHHRYDWMDARETQEERHEYLNKKAEEIGQSTLDAIDSRKHTLLVHDAPPGVGKSSAVAPITRIRNIAYIMSRHDMTKSIPALDGINEAQPPKDGNCYNPKAHLYAIAMGYSGASIHPGDKYHKQWELPGSMIYMYNHIITPYPLRHLDGWAIDEFDLDRFYPIDTYDPRELQSNLEESDTLENALLSAIASAQITVKRELRAYFRETNNYMNEIRGKMVFDLLNEKLGGNLYSIVVRLSVKFRKEYDRPKLDKELVDEMQDLPGTGIVKIVRALRKEIQFWLTGKEFNSRIGLSGRSITITNFLRVYNNGDIPSITVLDATSEANILSRSFPSWDIEVKHCKVDPPPDGTYIWVNTGKRWGKISLTACSGAYPEQQRAINTVKMVMRKHGIVPKRLGIITHQDFVKALGDGLGASEEDRLYFGGQCGSNALEECDVLVVVGTPTPSPDSIMRNAQAIFYYGEPVLSPQDHRYGFVRHYMTQRELTQSCHRNRPLRYHGRTVIVLSNLWPDYLEPTHEVVEIPYMDTDGTSTDDRMDAAIERLEARGEKIIVDTVQKESGVDRNLIGPYLKIRKAENRIKYSASLLKSL